MKKKLYYINCPQYPNRLWFVKALNKNDVEKSFIEGWKKCPAFSVVEVTDLAHFMEIIDEQHQTDDELTIIDSIEA